MNRTTKNLNVAMTESQLPKTPPKQKVENHVSKGHQIVVDTALKKCADSHSPRTPYNRTLTPRAFKDSLHDVLSTTSGRRNFAQKSEMYLSSQIISCQVKKHVDVHVNLTPQNRQKPKTFYLVVIDNEVGQNWMVSWTYNDFLTLHNKLKGSYPMLKAFRFPPKGKAEKEKRQEAFNQYVQLLLPLSKQGARSKLPKESLPREVVNFFLPGEIVTSDVVEFYDRFPEGEIECRTNTLATFLAGGKRTFYVVEITTDSGITWRIERTYTEFKKLFQAMKAKLKKKKWKFPRKAYLDSGKIRVKNERKEKFLELCNIYLNQKPQGLAVWSFFLPQSMKEVQAFMTA